MKFGIKIFVAILVVGVTIFGAWAFFFKEKDDVKAYNRTAELLNYKQSLNLQEKLDILTERGYLGDNPENIITDSTNTNIKILDFRKIMISQNPIESYDGNGILLHSYYSYDVTHALLDEMLVYYLPFLQGGGVDMLSYGKLNSDIKSLIASLKNFGMSIDNLISFQHSITGTPTEMEVLYGHYNGVRLKYREVLHDESLVVLGLRNYINNGVYRKEFKSDTLTALYDAGAYSIKYLSSVPVIEEIEYANDARKIFNMLKNYQSGQNIFTGEYSEFEFLTKYNILVKQYFDIIDKIFASKYLDKKNMSEGKNLSTIVELAHQPIIVYLNALGLKEK